MSTNIDDDASDAMPEGRGEALAGPGEDSVPVLLPFTIVGQLPIAMLVVDAKQGVLIHANRPAAELLKLPHPLPMIGSDWRLAAASFQGLHPDGHPYEPGEWPLAHTL